jgi:ssDNA-binding replication factor A large subunit
MNENCNRLVEFIANSSGVSPEEVERKIEAKRAKLSGLISREGAAQVIAAELGVNFDKQIVKIVHLVPGMRKINLIGKVINLAPIREYNKNGRSGRIGSFVLADDTSNIRVVLWDENHIDLISKGSIKEDRFVEINNASIKNGELHLGSFSDIKPSDKVISSVVVEKPVIKKTIIQFDQNDTVSTRAFIVQMFEPRFFEICPQCKKKVDESKECQEHGKVISEKRALIGFVLDDGTDSIRAVMFSDQLDKLISKGELENPDLFSIKKEEILGKEMFISGQVRKNNLFERKEFIISDIKEIDLNNLILELEK